MVINIDKITNETTLHDVALFIKYISGHRLALRYRLISVYAVEQREWAIDPTMVTTKYKFLAYRHDSIDSELWEYKNFRNPDGSDLTEGVFPIRA